MKMHYPSGCHPKREENNVSNRYKWEKTFGIDFKSLFVFLKNGKVNLEKKVCWA